MAKRNRVLLGVLVAAVLALLIALCFVGNTFARYTLSQEEKVTASIAEWGVSVDDATTSSGTFSSGELGTIKPLAASYADASDTSNTDVTLPRQYENFLCVAELKNTGAVDAMVQLSLPEDSAVTASYKEGYDATADTATYGSTKTGVTLAGEMSQHFVVTAYYSATAGITATDGTYTDESGTTATDKATLTKIDDSTASFKLLANGSTASEGEYTDVYIYFDVLWITDLGNETDGYTDGDDFDTWAGTNVTGFSFAVEIEAYQVS